MGYGNPSTYEGIDWDTPFMLDQYVQSRRPVAAGDIAPRSGGTMSKTRFRFSALLLVAAVAFVACDSASEPLAPQVSAAKGGDTGNEKFTFEGVTLVDGELVVEDAIVEAAVKDKKNDKQDFTECVYFTEGHRDNLGTFGTGDFASLDADEVREFCVSSFPQRQ